MRTGIPLLLSILVAVPVLAAAVQARCLAAAAQFNLVAYSTAEESYAAPDTGVQQALPARCRRSHAVVLPSGDQARAIHRLCLPTEYNRRPVAGPYVTNSSTAKRRRPLGTRTSATGGVGGLFRHELGFVFAVQGNPKNIKTWDDL